MTEFLERLDAQRAVLTVVNRHEWKEKLFGLSRGSIERWLEANKEIAPDGTYSLINNAAEKLYFLANKSQEQITEEYVSASSEIKKIVLRIEETLGESK